MGKYCVLYDPFLGGRSFRPEVVAWSTLQGEIVYQDITSVDYETFIDTVNLAAEDKIIVCGDDGTLNRFVNEFYALVAKNNIYYYAVGSQTEFACDIGKQPGAEPTFLINRYLKELPSVAFGQLDRQFLTGIGFGLDSFVGETARQRVKDGKTANYKSLVRRAVLQYKPGKVAVMVDGKLHVYEKTWLVAAMHGKSLWGGVPMAPNQDRMDKRKRLTVIVVHDIGKLKMLSILQSLFKGKHVNRKSAVDVLNGHSINVTSEHPNLLCVDGTLYPGITTYQVKSSGFVADSRKKLNHNRQGGLI